MNVFQTDPIESVILLLTLACFVLVVVAALVSLIYLPLIARRLKRLEQQQSRGY